jgi:hypothetical protein
MQDTTNVVDESDLEHADDHLDQAAEVAAMVASHPDYYAVLSWEIRPALTPNTDDGE